MFRNLGGSSSDLDQHYFGETAASDPAVGIKKLVHFLASRPTPVRIAWYLTLAIPWPEGAASTVIVTADESGDLSLRGQFGSIDLAPVVRSSPSIFCEHPIAACIRLSQVQTFAVTDPQSGDVQAGQELMPFSIAPEREWLCLPMSSPHGALGALCMAFDRPVLLPSRTSIWLPEYVSVVALYLQLMGYTNAGDGVIYKGARGALSIVWDDSTDVDDFGFTQRQRRVLQLMGQHLTNRQIGEQLDYSESTIRQDTMVIYRAFSVSGRRAAIEQARSLGLI